MSWFNNWFGDSSGGSAGGSIMTLTPADGSLLDPDPETARFTPIVATIVVNAGTIPLIYVSVGTLAWMVYDTDGFVAGFAEHSTGVQTGTDDDDNPIWVFSIIPNGGWWRSNITVEFVSGIILT